MSIQALPGDSGTDQTVGFGDVTPRASVQGSESEEQRGVQDSTPAIKDISEAEQRSDSAQGITSQRRRPAEGEVDTTPLARRG
jgi:hypothetical protein